MKKIASLGLLFGGMAFLSDGHVMGQEPVRPTSVFSQSLASEQSPAFFDDQTIVPTSFRSQSACGCATAPVAAGCNTCSTCAPGDPCAGKLQSFFDRDCGGNLVNDLGLTLGGWMSFGYTFNTDSPSDRTNGPVTFNDRSNDFLFNQLNLVLAKELDTESDAFSFGGRMDFMVGSDTRFTKSTGFDDGWGGNDTYSIAMPQLYAEMYAPIGNGLTVKAGHFYTIIGYETVTAPDNFFYSHAYTMQYGEPFTHWGSIATYNVSDNLMGGSLSVTGGAVTGWDDLENQDGNWSFLGGVNWSNECTGTSLAATLITGNEYAPDTGIPFVRVGRTNRTMYSLVLTQKLGDKLTYVFQHDHGMQDQAATPNNFLQTDDAEWYGINQYLFYDINDDLRAGVRFEWFRDDDEAFDATLGIPGSGNGPNRTGIRLPISGSYYALTAGLNWAVTDCIMVRPEARWDWSSANARNPLLLGNPPTGNRPYDNGTSGSQFLLATDVIIKF